MDYDMIGPALVLGLGCIGSSIGCGIGGMTLHAIMSRVEENHGKFIVMSALPALQSLLGFILMLQLRDSIKIGVLSGVSGIGIGFSVGMALMVASIYIGRCAASGIQAAAKQPSILAKSWVPLGMVESFSIFATVFALLLIK